MLLGAHAEGVRNVLAVTGDPPEVGDYPGRRGVYEIDSIGLTQLMTNLNRGEDFNGRADRRADVLLPRRGRQPDAPTTSTSSSSGSSRSSKRERSSR